MTTATLLLGADYRPLRVLEPRQALELMQRRSDCVVPVVDETGEIPVALEVRSGKDTFKIPQILCLTRYHNVPKRGAKWSKRAVLARDQFTCAYCGHSLGATVKGKTLRRSDLTVDHILPVSRGGRNTWGNTVCACLRCNRQKNARTPHEAGMKLLIEPKTPRVNYLVVSGEVPASWKIYLESKTSG